MRRCDIGIVINFFRILTKATRRLHSDKDIAVKRTRHQQTTIIFHNLTRGLTPIMHKLFAHLLLHGSKKILVFPAGQLVSLANLLFCEQAAVISGVSSEQLDKFLGILGNPIYAVTALLHSGKHTTDAFNCIQAQGTTNVRIAWGIVVENNSNFLLTVGLVAQHSPLFSLRCHTLYPFSIWKITYITIFQYFFVGNGYTVDNAIKFRQRYADGNLHRVHAFKAVFPFLIRSNCRISSQNRYI